MKKLNTTINGYSVELIKRNNHIFLTCNESELPAYHIRNIVQLVQRYEAFFNIGHPEKNGDIDYSVKIRLTEHVFNNNLFGMVCNYSEIETLFKEIYYEKT